MEQFTNLLWLDMSQACAYVGLCDRTLRQAIKDGRLTAYRTAPDKPRSPFRFKRADLDGFLIGGLVHPSEAR
jgi:excisionase family DNA binding protein